ncbi:MAG TPA: LysM peptidoglycan-binding domain-containing protein [Sedimentisphaerales bacterium]|nr:LysM peptidoglycan-binding domain-containing protein [Sedimentisphaerales bacterium]
MTSDAKVGLLLGLVFIFIIAFIINGLPTFRIEKQNNHQLTTNITSLQNEALGIGSKEREVIKQTQQVRRQSFAEVGPRPPADQVRPQMPSAEGTTSLTEPQQSVLVVPVNPQPVVENKQVVAEQKQPAVENKQLVAEDKASVVEKSQSVTTKKENQAVEPGKPDLVKVYVVEEGENLSEIAKKFYGPEEGNRIANVTKIFQANSNVLKSPDEVRAGQKIVIPALDADGGNRNKIKKLLGSGLFEAVGSIGKRHPAQENAKPRPSGEYVVREGDSLWGIAAEKLGNGSRYREIAKLNAGILEDDDTVIVGTRLKIPGR